VVAVSDDDEVSDSWLEQCDPESDPLLPEQVSIPIPFRLSVMARFATSPRVDRRVPRVESTLRRIRQDLVTRTMDVQLFGPGSRL
jgi:hypothetical protein